MINFDSLTLRAFLAENIEFLEGARIQKIQQPTRQEFIFGVRNDGESRKFYINIHPKFFHVCFASKENEEKRLLEIPQSPPMFCMLLRKYLEGARIAKVAMPENERILEFYFETKNELSESIYLCLAIELMGKHSNVVLYNHDTNVIVGCAHNIGAEKSREREMQGGLPYVYPPRQHKKNIFTISYLEFFEEIKSSPLDLYKVVSDKFFGFSQSFARQICEHSGILVGKPYVKSDLEKLFLNLQKYGGLKDISPVISKDFQEFSLYQELLPEGMASSSVNEMIDNYFSHHQLQERIKNNRQKFSAVVSAKLKKTNNALEKLKKQLKSQEKADSYRKNGDLIMANLFNNKDFSSYIEVFDYEKNANIKIDLDETKTLKENANRYFKLYTKAKTAFVKSTEFIENLVEEKEYLEQLAYSIDCAETISDFSEIEEEIVKLKLNNQNAESAPASLRRSKAAKAAKIAKRPVMVEKKINVTQVQVDGLTVLVGKNNKQNNYIVSRLASDEDLWFHTRNCAGSHVLLKLNDGAEPDDKIIFECAKLAKENSKGKDSSKVGVIYTKRKFLKKPPGAKLGYVTYKNEKEIIID